MCAMTRSVRPWCLKRRTSRIRRIDNLWVGIRIPHWLNEKPIARLSCRPKRPAPPKGAHDRLKSMLTIPRNTQAVEYVRICSLYGAGFFYIPGTDTCIKLGGYLRIDTTFNGGIYDAPAWSGDLGQGNRFADRINSRSRMALTVDTRTATEYGVVRTFGQGDFQFNNFGTSSPSALGGTAATPALASALGGLNGSLLNNPG